ncbi:hypothetical protein X777_13002, partial [Ooceraea biroi]
EVTGCRPLWVAGGRETRARRGETVKEETLKKRETWKGSAGGGVSVSVRSGQEKRPAPLSRSFGLFALEKKEIQMDDRKWWTVSDKGSRRNGTRRGRSAAVAGPEEWTSLFSRLWWKRFSRIAVNR